MSARAIMPENRLARALRPAGGLDARELIAQAEARIELLRPSIRAHVQEMVGEIAPFARQDDDSLFAGRRRLGAAALSVAEVAGAAGMVSVGEIARGLSAMLNSILAKGIWHTDPLRLHIHALALAMQAGDDACPQTQLMLARLSQMRKVLDVAE